MLKELRKNKMSVVVTGILFGVMGVLIIPIINSGNCKNIRYIIPKVS